jgi:hypothetical protein
VPRLSSTSGEAELAPKVWSMSCRITCPVRGCQMACAHVMMLVNLFDKTVVLLKDSPAVRCEVGVRIECCCLPTALGQALSLTLEAGSDEADMAALG